jgi:AcrR family transcriptional regulator
VQYKEILVPPRKKAHPTQRPESRDAIVSAAERLFLKQGFDDVSMDDLAESAGVARRTLYNQFASKEEILREMLGRLSNRLRDVLPPGIETEGNAETVLRLVAKAILTFQAPPLYAGLLRMTVADSRRLPWIAKAFESVHRPYLDRFARYFEHLTQLGVLDVPHPLLAAHQFLGLINGPTLWPRVLNQAGIAEPTETVIEEAVRMFLLRYGAQNAAELRTRL